MTLVYKQAGFTLIELLVVLSISGMLMAFVGPVAMEQIDASKAKSEIGKLENIIKEASTKAYTKGESIVLLFNHKTVKKHSEPNKAMMFEYLSFPGQRLLFNRNGYSNKIEVQYIYKGVTSSLNIYHTLGYTADEFIYAP